MSEALENELTEEAAAIAQPQPQPQQVVQYVYLEPPTKYEVVATMLSVDNPESLARMEAGDPTVNHSRLVAGDIVEAEVLGSALDRFLRLGAVRIYYGPKPAIKAAKPEIAPFAVPGAAASWQVGAENGKAYMPSVQVRNITSPDEYQPQPGTVVFQQQPPAPAPVAPVPAASEAASSSKKTSK